MDKILPVLPGKWMLKLNLGRQNLQRLRLPEVWAGLATALSRFPQPEAFTEIYKEV